MVLKSIGQVFGFGPNNQRNVNLNKETENLTPEFTNLKQIGEQFGYNTALPMLNNMSVNQFAEANKQRFLGEGKKTITYGGKEFITDKDQPTGLPGLAASVQDFFDPSKDRDKKGKIKFNPFAEASEANIGLKEFKPKLSDVILDPSESRQAKSLYKQETAGPTSGIQQQLDLIRSGAGNELVDFYSQAGKRAAGDAFKQYALTEPIRQMFANRAGNIATQRFLDAQGVLEQMPSAVQDIMSKKQRQILESQVGAAEMAKATADQQDAATRFAGLGMQRQFGQNVVYTPPLLRG